MFKYVATAALSSIMLFGAVPSIAQDKENPAIKARQSLMQLYSFNLSQLGAMAKEEVAYDRDTASAAAQNLVTLSRVSQSAMWPPGTDSETSATSRALPALWQNFDPAKGKAFSDAAVAMEVAAKTDLAALQAAMGALGASCSGCHKPYRGPRK